MVQTKKPLISLAMNKQKRNKDIILTVAKLYWQHIDDHIDVYAFK